MAIEAIASEGVAIELSICSIAMVVYHSSYQKLLQYYDYISKDMRKELSCFVQMIPLQFIGKLNIFEQPD